MRWFGRHPTLVAALLLWALAPARAAAQAGGTLFGQVTDRAGAPLPDAGVAARAEGEETVRRAARTDANGMYHLDGLPAGRYRLRADRPGYTGQEREVSLAAGERRRVDVRLRLDTVVLEGVVVTGQREADRARARFQTEPGVTAQVVGGEELKLLPGLAEADVVRAVELLPGVVSTSDFSSAFHVRGGSADQNLIQLDGFTIFNPFHLGGLFSVFNSDAIARAELLAGGFGSEYGGRVSSVLNVESKPGGEEGLSFDGGISVLASRLLVRSQLPAALLRPLGGEGGSWFVSARRSYFDQILRPWVDFPYHLTDLQGFASMVTRGGGRVSLTGYGGNDVLDLSDFQPPGGDADSSNILRIRWNWGNRVAGVRWEQPFAGAWTADSRLGYSAYREELGFTDFGDTRFASHIRQLSLHTDLARELGASATLRTGAAVERLSYDNLVQGGGTTFLSSGGHGVLGALYGSVRWRPGERWIVEPGLRADLWSAAELARTHLSPRLAVKRFFGRERDAAVKLSLGRYVQFLHSLRNEELPVSNDNWVLSGRYVPPVVSDQAQLGVERYWGEGWSASAEGYYRSFRGVTDFNLADDPNDPADDLLAGDGRSYGLDLLLRRSTGPLTGWATLSLLRATRTLPDPLAAGWEDLPPTTTFPPIYDRRVDVDVVLEYRLPRGLQLGARWNYGSPLPYTRPTAQYFAWRYDAILGQFEPAQPRGQDQPPLYVVPGERNAERYPPYHRLDLTLRRTFQRRWGSWTPYLQVLNAYNRNNVLYYFYNYDRLPPTRSGVSMFPLLPAVGLEASF